MIIESIAKVCHQANKAVCEAQGDMSQVDWDNAPADIQQSAISGVTYRLQNPTATPEQQHDEWSRFKLDDGWVYGETKDAGAKTHPCLVPYVDLPFGQKIKDMTFVAIVDAMKD